MQAGRGLAMALGDVDVDNDRELGYTLYVTVKTHARAFSKPNGMFTVENCGEVGRCQRVVVACAPPSSSLWGILSLWC